MQGKKTYKMQGKKTVLQALPLSFWLKASPFL